LCLSAVNLVNSSLGIHSTPVQPARATEHYVATKERRDLRHKYRTAYTSYMSCIHALSDASEQNGLPAKDIFEKEANGISELNAARDAFVEVLLNGS
jgi:hypothetical protein